MELIILKVCMAVLVDGTEFVGLLDTFRIIPRQDPACLISQDFVVGALGIVSLIFIVSSDFHLADAPARTTPSPWAKYDSAALWLVVAVMWVPLSYSTARSS